MCFVCAGAGHEAKNCPRRAANKRAAPADPTRKSAPKAPRTFTAAVQLAVVDLPPADPAHDPPADEVPPPVPEAMCDTPSDHQVDILHLVQYSTRVPPPEQEPPRDATLAITGSDKPVDPSVTSDPPASDKPVEQHLPASTSTGPTESNMETATRVEHDPPPPMDTNSPSVVIDTSAYSMDAFPNLDQKTPL